MQKALPHFAPVYLTAVGSSHLLQHDGMRSVWNLQKMLSCCPQNSKPFTLPRNSVSWPPLYDLIPGLYCLLTTLLSTHMEHTSKGDTPIIY